MWDTAKWANTKKNNAVLVNASGSPAYTFGDAEIETLKESTDETDQKQGWNIAYTSKEKTCGDASDKPFVVRIEGQCDQTATTSTFTSGA